MKHPPKRASRGRRRRRRACASAAGLAVAAGILTACSSANAKDTLVWYINPDAGGQAAVAANCSTDQYTITTQVLPQDANEQRIQLTRRLAAQDSGIDIMSIDPPFTAEFSNADFLAPLPQSLQDKLRQQSFKSATDAATWEGELVVAPFWSNTQVLWYRKSFAEKAGLDMSKPVTWDQIIDAAAQNGGKVAVQSNKYEGYVVWINALISGAGGEIATDTSKGLDMKLEIDSSAGDKAAAVIDKLAHSSAAPADLSVAQEGQAASTFATPQGSFMVNWTYIYNSYEAIDPGFNKDIGYTRYPETVQGEPSRPPYGGIGLGVSAYSSHVDEAIQAVECLTSPENQEVNAELTGNMPASQAGYEANDNALQKTAGGPLPPYPAPLLELYQQSLSEAAPRTTTPYWSDISGGLQSTWHPPSGVSSSTPASSQTFIDNVLHGRSLL